MTDIDKMTHAHIDDDEDEDMTFDISIITIRSQLDTSFAIPIRYNCSYKYIYVDDENEYFSFTNRDPQSDAYIFVMNGDNATHLSYMLLMIGYLKGFISKKRIIIVSKCKYDVIKEYEYVICNTKKDITNVQFKKSFDNLLNNIVSEKYIEMAHRMCPCCLRETEEPLELLIKENDGQKYVLICGDCIYFLNKFDDDVHNYIDVDEELSKRFFAKSDSYIFNDERVVYLESLIKKSEVYTVKKDSFSNPFRQPFIKSFVDLCYESKKNICSTDYSHDIKKYKKYHPLTNEKITLFLNKMNDRENKTEMTFDCHFVMMILKICYGDELLKTLTMDQCRKIIDNIFAMCTEKQNIFDNSVVNLVYYKIFGQALYLIKTIHTEFHLKNTTVAQTLWTKIYNFFIVENDKIIKFESVFFEFFEITIMCLTLCEPFIKQLILMSLGEINDFLKLERITFADYYYQTIQIANVIGKKIETIKGSKINQYDINFQRCLRNEIEDINDSYINKLKMDKTKCIFDKIIYIVLPFDKTHGATFF